MTVTEVASEEEVPSERRPPNQSGRQGGDTRRELILTSPVLSDGRDRRVVHHRDMASCRRASRSRSWPRHLVAGRSEHGLRTASRMGTSHDLHLWSARFPEPADALLRFHGCPVPRVSGNRDHGDVLASDPRVSPKLLASCCGIHQLRDRCHLHCPRRSWRSHHGSDHRVGRALHSPRRPSATTSMDRCAWRGGRSHSSREVHGRPHCRRRPAGPGGIGSRCSTLFGGRNHRRNDAGRHGRHRVGGDWEQPGRSRRIRSECGRRGGWLLERDAAGCPEC